MLQKLLLLLLIFSTSIFAQEQQKGVNYGVLPVFSFNSDEGIVLGGELKRYNYGDGTTLPFYNYMTLNTYLNSNGAFSVSLSRDQVKTFGTDIRTSSSISASQNFGNYFLGNTDEIEFDRARFDSASYYSFKSFGFNIGVATRIPIDLINGIERMDIKTGLQFVYESPWGTDANRFINSSGTAGSEGAFLSILDIAFVLERRNSEFRAQKGYLVDIGFKYAPPLVSTHQTIQNRIVSVGFIPLVDHGISASLAGKFKLVNTLGDTPYWFKPSLGGGGELRGYMYRRFSSDNTIAYTIELRTWLLKIPFKNIQLGTNLFFDGGREFSNDNWNQIFNKHKHTLGFGGVMSIFTPDYILKYDIGFSNDGIGIYLGTGYSF